MIIRKDMCMKWYYILIIGLMLLIGGCFVFKKDSVPMGERTVEAVKLHFESFIPKVMQAGATAIGHNVYFKEKQSDLHPWTNQNHMYYVLHELCHVIDQYEEIGIQDYIFGYYGHWMGNGFKYENIPMEKFCNAKMLLQPTERKRQIILRYFK